MGLQKFRTLKDNPACSDYVLDLLQYVEEYMLRVTKEKRAEIGSIVAKFEEFNRCCADDSEYCALRTKLAKRTDSGLSEIAEEIAEVPDAPGKAIIVSQPLPDHAMQRRAHVPSPNRRSPTLPCYPGSIASTSRHGSRSSFASAGTTKPMSNLGSQVHMYTEPDSPISEIGSTLTEYNALAPSVPAGLERVYRTKSGEARAASFSRETITASDIRQEAQSSSERSPHQTEFPSNISANGKILAEDSQDFNSRDVPKGSLASDAVGNGTTGVPKAPKTDTIESEAVDLQQSRSEAQAARPSGDRRSGKLSQIWKSVTTRLCSC